MENFKHIPSNKPNELLECFDENENPIQPKLRQEVHSKPYAIWHGVTVVWLFNNHGEILCSKRSNYIEGNPGKWQTYFGGHVKFGSNFLETAMIELKEEIGLKLPSDKFILVDFGKREDVMHIYKNYAILFNGDLSKFDFTDGEIAGVKWFSFEDYEKEKDREPNNWCNSIRLNQYEKAITALKILYK